MSTAQRYAAAAYRDGLTEQTIRDLASLATWGKNLQNCERDLHRWLPHAFDSKLRTHSTAIEYFNPDTARIEMMELPILLASDVLNSVWRKGSTKVWDALIGCTPEKCGLFWQYCEQDWATDHPVIQPLGFQFRYSCPPVGNEIQWDYV